MANAWKGKPVCIPAFWHKNKTSCISVSLICAKGSFFLTAWMISVLSRCFFNMALCKSKQPSRERQTLSGEEVSSGANRLPLGIWNRHKRSWVFAKGKTGWATMAKQKQERSSSSYELHKQKKDSRWKERRNLEIQIIPLHTICWRIAYMSEETKSAVFSMIFSSLYMLDQPNSSHS